PVKDQVKQWLGINKKRPTVARYDRYGPKLMLILAMDYDGICYCELLEARQTVNHERYLQFLQRLMGKWRRKRKYTVWLLDDNAGPHRHAAVRTWLDATKIERGIQPPHSPDLNPFDYGSFNQLKRAIGGVPYADAPALRAAFGQGDSGWETKPPESGCSDTAGTLPMLPGCRWTILRSVTVITFPSLPFRAFFPIVLQM
ncbi:transposase, partial [Salmonella enterica subsp. enterica serovar Typhimurium]|nr:transposase [Salmonella enterica subsp. enterica serovar Typhimurium]